MAELERFPFPITFVIVNLLFPIFPTLWQHLKQAPEAGGCATGDGGDNGDGGHRRDMGETGETVDTALCPLGHVLRHYLTEIKPKMGEISNS